MTEAEVMTFVSRLRHEMLTTIREGGCVELARVTWSDPGPCNPVNVSQVQITLRPRE